MAPHPLSTQGGDYLTGLWACLLMYIYAHYSYPRIDPFVLVRRGLCVRVPAKYIQAGVAFTGSVLYQFNVHWHGFRRSFLTRWDVLVLAVEVGKQVLLLSSSFVEVRYVLPLLCCVVYFVRCPL